MRPRLSAIVRFAAFASLLVTAGAQAEPVVTALPTPLETRNAPVEWTATGPDALTITAGPGANWFVSPGTGKSVDTAPTLLVRPAGDFALSVRLSLQPKKRWDSGCVALFVDNGHWAKLCLENAQGEGKLAVVSVVNRGDSDDVYTDFFAPENTIYLKVARKGAAFLFFASHDSKEWRMFRTFTFMGSDLGRLRAGLLAQSPVGDGMTVQFSEIRYTPEP